MAPHTRPGPTGRIGQGVHVSRPASFSLGFALCAAVAMVAPDAHAQGRLKQPLRILVPIAPGGQSDVVAPLLAVPLREDLGQPVVVENRPGGSGRIAVDALRSAAPDGTTVLFTPIAVPVFVPLFLKDPSYEPTKDLAPVAQITRYQFALAVAVGHPARTVPE